MAQKKKTLLCPVPSIGGDVSTARYAAIELSEEVVRVLVPYLKTIMEACRKLVEGPARASFYRLELHTGGAFAPRWYSGVDDDGVNLLDKSGRDWAQKPDGLKLRKADLVPAARLTCEYVSIQPEGVFWTYREPDVEIDVETPVLPWSQLETLFD